jgi:hypothetical protein
MTVDLDAAARFMAAHARVLDRRRFGVLLGNGTPLACSRPWTDTAPRQRLWLGTRTRL